MLLHKGESIRCFSSYSQRSLCSPSSPDRHDVICSHWRAYIYLFRVYRNRNARRVSEVWKVLLAQEWLAAANEHENCSDEAETHRLKAELLVKQDDSNAAEAQSCFERAIEIAHGQSAKSWELRATMSLARSARDARQYLRLVHRGLRRGFEGRQGAAGGAERLKPTRAGCPVALAKQPS
jgi:hypothetical protein